MKCLDSIGFVQSGIRIGIVSCSIAICFVSCIREEFHLTEETHLTGELQPAWALPLGQLEFAFNNHWDFLDSLHIESNATNGMLQYVQPFEAFSSAPLLMNALEESFAFEWDVDDAAAAILSLLPKNQSVSHASTIDWNWGTQEMSSLDSLWLNSGSLLLEVSSNLPMDCDVLIRSSSIISGGEVFECRIELDYSGALPVTASQLITIDNSSVIFSDPMSPSVRLHWDVQCAGAGESVSAGEALSMSLSLNETEIEGAFGEFAEETSWSFEMGQTLPALENLIPGDVHFADPQIHLWMNNSSGIPIGIEWSEMKFLNNGLPMILSGSDIEDFPIVSGALVPGEDVETIHVIDNSGTSPALTAILDDMPDSLSIGGAIVINPESESPNFLLSTSRVALKGELRLPMNGWASAMNWSDTINANISESLKNALQAPLDWQDIESVSVRLRCENRLPVGIQVQAVFLNDHGDVLDSLSSNAEGWTLIGAGQVETQGSPNDSGFGRVSHPQMETVDWTFDREMAQALMTENCQSVIIEAKLETSGASHGQDVRFYPNDGLRMELGLKVDFDLSVTP